MWISSIGKFEKGMVTCQVHGHQYDVKAGKFVKDVSTFLKTVIDGDSYDLNSYDVEVKEESVFVEF